LENTKCNSIALILNYAEPPVFLNKTMNSSVLKATAVLSLIIAVSLLYANTIEAPFVLDDRPGIAHNTYIRINEISFDSLVQVIFQQNSYPLRPLPKITFALNYYFHQYNLQGYHVVNIIIHMLSGILLFFFIKTTLNTPALKSRYTSPGLIAFITALIWTVHPLHTQSVTYIVQRMNSLSAMFYLLAMLLYAKGRMQQIKRTSQNETGCRPRISIAALYFSGSAAAWLMALCSKQNAALLPFFILLYEWFFFQNLNQDWLQRNKKIMLFIITIFSFAVFLLLGTDPLESFKRLADFKAHEFTFLERILTQPRVIIHYVSLLFYPHPSRLTFDYDFPISHSLIDPATTLPVFFILAGCLWLACYAAKQHRLLSFAILWFLGNLIIESTVIPLAIIYEHRTYLPSMLIFLPAVTAGHHFIKHKWTAIVLICAITSLFSFWTYQRNSLWGDPVAFWSDCVAKSPQKARPRNSLGLAVEDQGRIDDAIKHYREAVRIQPRYWKAHNNLGSALKNQGHVNEAVEHYIKTLRLNPECVEAHHNLGAVLEDKGRLNDAIKHYQEALRIKPDSAITYYRMGNALQVQGRIDDAIIHYKKAANINPDSVDVHFMLGNILQTRGRVDESITHYKKALRINPAYAAAHINLGAALKKQGRIAEAIQHYQEALSITPDSINAHINLGNALQAQERVDEAIEHYKKALQINPGNINAKNSLEDALARQQQE